jgi:hypothetical protein
VKTSFTRDELLKWIDATRAEVVVGPELAAPDKQWTSAEVTDAWATSAHNVLSMLEEFIEKS